MKKLLFFLFLLFLFLISYFREVTFIGINSIIAGHEHNYANTQLPEFFYSFSSTQLSQLKWVLTAAYSLLFIIVTYIGIRYSIGKTAGRWALIVYGFFLCAAFVVALIGLIFFDFAEVYPFVRDVVGIIHSPLIFLLISISHYSIGILKKP